MPVLVHAPPLAGLVTAGLPPAGVIVTVTVARLGVALPAVNAMLPFTVPVGGGAVQVTLKSTPVTGAAATVTGSGAGLVQFEGRTASVAE
jgi:hypothetical protein